MMAHAPSVHEIVAVEAEWELYLPPMVVEYEGQRDYILMPTPYGSGALSFSLRVPAEVQGEVELVVLLYKLVYCDCSGTRTRKDTATLRASTDSDVELAHGKKLRIMNEGGAVRAPFVISLPQTHARGPGSPTGPGTDAASRYSHTAIRVLGRPARVQGFIFVHPDLALGHPRHARFALQVCGVLPSSRSTLQFYTDIRGAFKYRARAKTSSGKCVEPDTAPRTERLARALSPCSGRVRPTADELELYALRSGGEEVLSGGILPAVAQTHDLPGAGLASVRLPQDLDDDCGEAIATTPSHNFPQCGALGTAPGAFGARDANPVDAYFGVESFHVPEGLHLSNHALTMGLHVDTDANAAAAGLCWQRPGDCWETRPGATDTRHALTTTLASVPPSPYGIGDATASISNTPRFDARVPDCVDPVFDWRPSVSGVASPLSLEARLERPFVDEHEVGFAHSFPSSMAAAGACNTAPAEHGPYAFIDELLSSTTTPSQASVQEPEVAPGDAAQAHREPLSPSQTLADGLSRLICDAAAPAPHVVSRKRARLGASGNTAAPLAPADHALHYRASRDSLLPAPDPCMAHAIVAPRHSAEKRVLNVHNALRELKKYDSI